MAEKSPVNNSQSILDKQNSVQKSENFQRGAQTQFSDMDFPGRALGNNPLMLISSGGHAFAIQPLLFVLSVSLILF